MNSNSGLQKVRMILFGFLMLFILNPISVSANGVSDAIQKVVNVYPNSCSYFTSDGKSDSNSSDSRCSLVNIPSRGGLPSGKMLKAVMHGHVMGLQSMYGMLYSDTVQIRRQKKSQPVN